MVEASKPTFSKSQNSSRIKFNNIFEELDPLSRKTKVMVTLAPLTWETRDILRLIDSGMNIARLDFKTGDQRVSYKNRLILSKNLSQISQHLFLTVLIFLTSNMLKLYKT